MYLYLVMEYLPGGDIMVSPPAHELQLRPVLFPQHLQHLAVSRQPEAWLLDLLVPSLDWSLA